MSARLRKTHHSSTNIKYDNFDQLDGRHPWMEVLPKGHVAYRVRELNQGQVIYFNFVLAKEMGLIDADHSFVMNKELENKILKTFSIQIINEFDELSKRRIDPNTIKENTYMATRYLQLQHNSKRGATSGDGRGVWNGIVQHAGQIWDVSSRGTGVTCLAPGAVAAQKPLRTGGTEFGYGCGQAELDELIGAAILAESMHLQGIQTERVLCVIDLGKGVGIGVRAAPNLIRPAHLFLYLKQSRYDELKTAVDFFLERQLINGRMKLGKKTNMYDHALSQMADSFAEFAAQLDIDYIFAWLDWDGDNVLADAGIIDYGSVRQFGIRHDSYRYDDVERYSTNLNEQRLKARQLVQVFAQLFDYLKTKTKKNLKSFANHPAVLHFDNHFKHHRSDRLLYRIGFDQAQRQRILKGHAELLHRFDKVFSYFERAKISGSVQKVADGVNHPALYNMRNILRILPEYYFKHQSEFQNISMNDEDFFQAILSSFAKHRDARMGNKHRFYIRKFQSLYKQLIIAAAGKVNVKKGLEEFCVRAKLLNSEKRITGDGLVELVEEILEERSRGLSAGETQRIIDRLVFENLKMPEVKLSHFYKLLKKEPSVSRHLYRRLLQIVVQNRETI